MSFNPLVDLGTLNRLASAVSWLDYPELNVTASFLGREGIRLAFEGEATRILPQMTGVVPSPEPYQQITVTVNLLKSQSLAAQYETQLAVNSVLGDGIVYTDANTLPPYPIFNCSIVNVRELNFSGEDAGYMVTASGYVLRNSSLWV